MEYTGIVAEPPIGTSLRRLWLAEVTIDVAPKVALGMHIDTRLGRTGYTGRQLRGTIVNNWGTIPSAPPAKQRSRADQKARRVNKMDKPALAAKPPSPVQSGPPIVRNQNRRIARSPPAAGNRFCSSMRPSSRLTLTGSAGSRCGRLDDRELDAERGSPGNRLDDIRRLLASYSRFEDDARSRRPPETRHTCRSASVG